MHWAAVEQAVLPRLPEDSREANLTLTTDNGTQGGWKQNLDYSTRVPSQSRWGCNIENLSGNLQYELFDCDESRVVVFSRNNWPCRGCSRRMLNQAPGIAARIETHRSTLRIAPRSSVINVRMAAIPEILFRHQ